MHQINKRNMRHSKAENKKMIDPDKRLIKKSKSGNKNAFGKLVKKYQRNILFLAYDIVGNYETAKDIAQETFIRAYQKINQFEERSLFSTWLFRITVNSANEFLRKNNKYKLENIEEDCLNNNHNNGNDEFISQNFENNLLRKEISVQLEQAINQLSLSQRNAIILKYFHYMNYREIAEVMECTENTVRTHIFRALNNLKLQLRNKKEELL
jgi:RNA polymerase sigma-70 factor, ECF subfamily